MYYSEVFFKKDIYNIIEDDVLLFFSNSPEESSILEFKSGDNLDIQKVYPEVCALHNTQGGLLIIGSPKPRKYDGREIFDGPLTRSPFKDKDWVYQKIAGKISPPPTSIKIHDVKMSDGKYVQIIYIPKSIHPPHQYLDNGIYYLRFETSSKFAPHGLVEAMFNKRQEPSVNCFISKFNFNFYDPTEIEFQITNTTDYPLLGVRGLIKFYNVDEVTQSGNINGDFIKLNESLDFDSNLTCFTADILRPDTVIVRGLASLHRYYVTTGKLPFLAQFYIWSQNMNLKNYGFIISPIQNKSIKYEIKANLFDDASKTIENVLLSEKDEEIISGLKTLLKSIKHN